MIATAQRPCYSLFPRRTRATPSRATWGEAPRLVRRLKRWEESVGRSLYYGFYMGKDRGMRVGRFRIGYIELFQWGSVETWGD